MAFVAGRTPVAGTIGKALMDKPVLPARLRCALNEIDTANQQDPRQELVETALLPKEYAYSLHMTRWLWALTDAPSEHLQIACRAQHLERWTRPRDAYPMDRAGYYQWRQACARYHAQRTVNIMIGCGYTAEDAASVAAILRKQKLKADPDTQLMEDVVCLVFLERYFQEFHQQHDDYDQAKWMRILQRTWSKMSEAGQQAALGLVGTLPENLQKLIGSALQPVADSLPVTSSTS